MFRLSMVLTLTAGAVILAGCDSKPSSPPGKAESAETKASAPATGSDPLASALSAAPASIAKDAAVIVMNPDGTMKSLRAGTNGFTCMPDNSATPGPDPMCMDGNAMKWAEAWIGRKTPPMDNVGLMYMLTGGTDASNTDPYGTKPADGSDWVKTGPHVMVVGSESLNRQYPGGETPDTTKPYVMFGGSPYAHVMIPIG